MKKIIILLIGIFSLHSSYSQIVYIPDAKFKAVLINNPLINTNSDTEIQVSEAIAFTGDINVYHDSISDLTGISSFINLTDLDCTGNQLTNLDVSSNTALTGLSCAANQLTSLDVSSNKALIHIYCGQNKLTSLDISSNTALTSLTCNMNQLTSLDVSLNTSLIDLNCMVNQIASLDVSLNPSLDYLYCNNNILHTLNLSGANALIWLQCGNNLFSNLDISGATFLHTFNASYCPNLRCIEVADVAAVNLKPNWYKDSTASYSLNCDTSITENTDAEFNLYPNPVNDILYISDLQVDDEWRVYDINGQVLLSGKCYNDKMKSIDTHGFSSGIYAIRFIRNHTNYVAKFAKN